MITLLSMGHYEVTAADGRTLGKVDGDNSAGFETRTVDGRKLGPFSTLDEALKPLIARDRTQSERAQTATPEHP